jgi:hypothetical protein
MDQKEKHGNSEEAQNKKGRRKNGEITPQNDCAKNLQYRPTRTDAKAAEISQQRP